MGFRGERDVSGCQWRNRQISVEQRANWVFRRFTMPSIGYYLKVTAIPSDLLQESVNKYNPAYSSWLVVRSKSGWDGFGGYRVGLNWTDEETNEHLISIAQKALDSHKRLHPYQEKFRKRCLQTLAGEIPFTPDTVEELNNWFGMMLGQARALINQPSNARNPNGPEENHRYHNEIQAIVGSIPQPRYTFDPKNPENFTLEYHVPNLPESSNTYMTPAELVLRRIGIIGMPVLRASMR